MNEELFDQDDANILHLAEHGVTPEEAEEVMLGEPIEVDFEVFDGEDRRSYVGQAREGSILRVAITLRGERIRIVTAFEAPRYWKNFYLENRANQQ